MHSPDATTTLAQAYAAYGARQAHDELPADVVHHAKRAFVDWLSALYPGARIPPGTCLAQAHKAELGHGHASIPGHATTAYPATAAWINASASHTVEFDDIFRDGVYHPGCPVISAALAIAEEQDCQGAHFLRAIIAGYEISTRIAAAVQPAHYRFFHTTGTVGAIGAAAAGALMARPGDADVMLHAMATAASFASGLQQAFRSDAMTKALHAGHAAAVGVRSALAAAAGVTGVPDILEGPVGFGHALAGGPDWQHSLDGLGRHYNITQITQKNHGCCGHTFAAIDAALHLRNVQGIKAEDIERIDVHTYRTALDVTGNFMPATAFECKFSLPYVVSHALVFNSVRLDAFQQARLQDQTVRSLMSRLSLHEDEALTASFPRQRAARVAIQTRDGRCLTHFSPWRQGDPESPLTDEALTEKYAELVTPVLGEERAQALLQAAWRLDAIKVRDLHLKNT
ncbi:MmgE/PrpD family protein [Allopusillimonas soli]|uniref:MmgE/PrpD family protein n=1 Tax=Allopusillimonas soli TaxID=659016 RepID=A0A853FCR3_9BURK|nr:MmgE/PrpD family protein [Allopusillimonas soli]NYT35856.1 MmgE/PrpD family protein [Allopusillimonas soli]TEA76222.1 MmgE/PrpD family protein [Allopusillimonas soli]